MNLLFEFSGDPFSDDLAMQYARMALAVSLENQVTMCFRSSGSALAMDCIDIPNNETDYFDQERFLVEQEIRMYALHQDVDSFRERLKECVQVTSPDELAEIYSQQDVIFRN
jgi:hypothetical protein